MSHSTDLTGLFFLNKGITPTVAAALPATLLSELSPDQVANIPRFSAQAFSDDQMDALPEESKEKLMSVVRGPISSHASNHLQQSILIVSFPLFLATIVNIMRF